MICCVQETQNKAIGKLKIKGWAKAEPGNKTSKQNKNTRSSPILISDKVEFRAQNSK